LSTIINDTLFLKTFIEILSTIIVDNISIKVLRKTDLITGENIYNIYKLNWACRVRDILFKYGFHNIWISQYVNHVDFSFYKYVAYEYN
jgi:hypothetical protein